MDDDFLRRLIQQRDEEVDEEAPAWLGCCLGSGLFFVVMIVGLSWIYGG